MMMVMIVRTASFCNVYSNNSCAWLQAQHKQAQQQALEQRAALAAADDHRLQQDLKHAAMLATLGAAHTGAVAALEAKLGQAEGAMTKINAEHAEELHQYDIDYDQILGQQQAKALQVLCLLAHLLTGLWIGVLGFAAT